MKKMIFQYDCVSPNSENELQFILAHLKTITRSTFLKYVEKDSIKDFEENLGYSSEFPMKNDWHISYFKSKTPKNKPVYGFIWSGIEYIFY